MKADDNTDLLRWLYIPVTHGLGGVCVGTFGGPGMPPRGSWRRASPQPEPADGEPQCGSLHVDGYRCRNEHLESIDMNRIGVVVTFLGSVHMYTREFDWTFRPGGGAPSC